MYRFEKKDLEIFLSQVATDSVNRDLDKHYKKARKIIQIHSFFVSAMFIGSLILLFFFDDGKTFDRAFPLTCCFIIWMVPLWMTLRTLPKWVDVTLDDIPFEKEEDVNETRH